MNQETINNEYNMENIVMALSEKTNLAKEDVAKIINTLFDYIQNTKVQEALFNQNNHEMLHQKMRYLWQNNFDNNLMLVKRAMKWLGILAESENYDAVNFMSKLLDLGKILAEDKSIPFSGKEGFAMTKEQALKKRMQLTRDKDFFKALTNKSDLSHKEAVKTLNGLNEIIANKNHI